MQTLAGARTPCTGSPSAVLTRDRRGGLLPGRRPTGGVSRQWLYTQPDLRARIEELRERPTAPATVPDGQRAREGSLRRRNETLLADNRRLREENQTLREELAILYGRLRADDER